MHTAELYAVYRSVINNALNDNEHLPSLPAITLQVRRAIHDDHTTVDSLADLVRRDPGISALLIKAASSPLYATLQAPKTLQDAIRLLGLKTVGNLVMLHSVRSLFVMRHPLIKKLFDITWKRLAVKTCIANCLAEKLRYQPRDQVQVAALLTEIGSLAVLAALRDLEEPPSEEIYFTLCRHYSKSLGTILLRKWNIDPQLIDAMRFCGHWQKTEAGALTLIDIINLAMYNTILYSPKGKTLPSLDSLAAYQKLSPLDAGVSKTNVLRIVADNKTQINDAIKEFLGVMAG